MKLCSFLPLALVDARSFCANRQHLYKFMEEKSMLLKREKSPPVPEMQELQITLLLSIVITMGFAWFYSTIHILLWITIGLYLS